MTSIELFVRHWFDHHALSRATSTLRAHSRDWIEEAANAHQGFATQLRAIALEALSSPDPTRVRRGLIALAVVADSSDLAAIEVLENAADSGVAADARATVFEIRNREQFR